MPQGLLTHTLRILDNLAEMIIMCHINRIDFGRNRIAMNILRGVTGWRVNDAFLAGGPQLGCLQAGTRNGVWDVTRIRINNVMSYARQWLGDGPETGEHDAKRSHVVSSTTEDGVSAPQSGATHFKERRNKNGRQGEKR